MILEPLQRFPITITPTPTYEGWGEITITLVDGEDYKANTNESSRIAKVVIEEAETSSRTIAITAPEAVIEGDNVEVVLTTSESLGAGESIEVAFNIVADSVGYYDANGSDTSPVTFTDAGNEQTITIATNDSDSFTTEDMINIEVVRGDQYEPASTTETPIIIVPKETLPVVSIMPAGSTSIEEGEDAVFTITATGITLSDVLPVLVTVAQGTGEDFIDESIRILPAVRVGRDGTGELRVKTVADKIDETDGTITATLGASPDATYVLGTPAQTSITIKDNDDGTLPSITIAGVSPVTEGEDVVFTLAANPALTGDSTIMVRVRISETGDFLATSAKDSPRVVMVPVGSTGGMLKLPTMSDAEVELGAMVNARVISEDISDGSAATYSIGENAFAQVTVEDNDDPVLPNVSIVAASSTPVAEAAGAMAVFNVMATVGTNADTTPIAVELMISEVGNFLATDAETARDPIMVTPGDAGSEVAVTHQEAIENDTTKEPNGKIIAKIANSASYSIGINAMAEVVIEDDEEVPTVSISAPEAGFIVEGNTDQISNYNFAVNLSHPTTEEVVVNFAVGKFRDSATFGDDYIVGNSAYSLTFPPDSTDSQYVNINVLGDIWYEGVEDEKFTITLSLPVGDAVAILAADPTATGAIREDDSPPTVTIADAEAVEGNDIVFTVTLSEVAGIPVTIHYSTIDDTATAPDTGEVDYVKQLGGVLTIPVSSSTGTTALTNTITIETMADDDPEIDETFYVSISTRSGANAVPGEKTNTTATGTIRTDDGPIVFVKNTDSNGSVFEGNDANFMVELVGDATGDVVVNWATADGSATQPGDYTTANNQVTLNTTDENSRTATFTVATIDDTDVLRLQKTLSLI